METQLSTNYIGHFLLTYLLLPRLIESGTETLRSRIVNVSSTAHYAANRIRIDDFSSKEFFLGCVSYSESKLYQVMHAIVLQELMRRKKAFVTVNSVHPGNTDTEIFQHTFYSKTPGLRKIFFQSPEQGADRVVYVALSKEIEGIGGKFFDNCQIKKPSKLARNREMQLKLWRKTCDILQIKDFDPQF